MGRRLVVVSIATFALLLGPASLAAGPPLASAADDQHKWREVRGEDLPPVWTEEVVYDSANDRTLAVIPGVDHEFVDTWVREGTTWREVETLHAPSHRTEFALAYDAEREEVVLFGGRECRECRSFVETWVFDGDDWALRTPPVQPPDSTGEMVDDPVRHQVVLFTGTFAEDGALTWTWDGSAWTSHDAQRGPHDDLHQNAMAWDASRQAVVLHGGYTFVDGERVYPAKTWAWDGTAWRSVAKGPQLATHGMSAYRQQIVLFGGNKLGVGSDATWLLRRHGWSRLDLARHPDYNPNSALTPLGRNRVLLTQTSGSSSADHWVFGPGG